MLFFFNIHYKVYINVCVLSVFILGMSSIVDIFTLSIKSNRMVGYRFEIIDILNPNNGV